MPVGQAEAEELNRRVARDLAWRGCVLAADFVRLLSLWQECGVEAPVSLERAMALLEGAKQSQ